MAIKMLNHFSNEHPSSSIPIVMRLSYEHLGPSAIESIEFADAKASDRNAMCLTEVTKL